MVIAYRQYLPWQDAAIYFSGRSVKTNIYIPIDYKSMVSSDKTIQIYNVIVSDMKKAIVPFLTIGCALIAVAFIAFSFDIMGYGAIPHMMSEVRK